MQCERLERVGTNLGCPSMMYGNLSDKKLLIKTYKFKRLGTPLSVIHFNPKISLSSMAGVSEST